MKIVLALGGNALGNTPADQLELVKDTACAIVDLVQEGHDVVVGHGNGPQVGMINLAFETSHDEETCPLMPFPECGAMSQGYIGYHLSQAITNELRKRNMKKNVTCLITQVEVDSGDPAFKEPTKPIGAFLTEEQVDVLKKETNYTFVEDSGRGFRRVVASPAPKAILELDTITRLIDAGTILITVGGGGVPVITQNNEIKGVDAVIDKDMSCALLAEQIHADMLVVLTAVDCVFINYGTPQQEKLKELTIEKAELLMADGHFGKGSMLPKVQACINFAKGGGRAVITSLRNAKSALNSGTAIINK